MVCIFEMHVHNKFKRDIWSNTNILHITILQIQMRLNPLEYNINIEIETRYNIVLIFSTTYIMKSLCIWSGSVCEIGL